MPDRYHPTSPFLNGLLLAEPEPLSKEEIARLIELMNDEDVSNRDWATMFLAHDDADAPEVRAAFRQRVSDNEAAVRAEALLGLALRDKATALPLVSRELEKESVTSVVFDAALEIADSALLPYLLPWRAARSDSPDSIDQTVEQAIVECGGPPLDRQAQGEIFNPTAIIRQSDASRLSADAADADARTDRRLARCRARDGFL